MLQTEIMELSNHDHMMFRACINLVKSHSSIYSDIKVCSDTGFTTYTYTYDVQSLPTHNDYNEEMRNER